MYIRAYYRCYAYPLFFPRGEISWNRWMPYIELVDDTNQVSVDEFAQQNPAYGFPSGMMFKIGIYHII